MTDEDTTTLPVETQGPELPRRKKRHRPSAPCKYEGCAGWAWAQGYCDPHYQRLKREGVIHKWRIMNDDLARFHTKYEVNTATGCWEWIGPIHPNGYGTFAVTVNGKSVSYRANRYAFEKLVGPVPKGMMVLHRCDNRRCVSPGCLYLGTGEDNRRDCVEKGRDADSRGTAGRSITPAMASNIRVMYARGLVGTYGNSPNPYSIKNIAAIYCVEYATIWEIIKGRAHLRP